MGGVFFGWVQHYVEWNNGKLRNNTTQSSPALSCSRPPSLILHSESRIAHSTHVPIHCTLLHSTSANLFVSGWVSAGLNEKLVSLIWIAAVCDESRKVILQNLYYLLKNFHKSYVYSIILICADSDMLYGRYCKIADGTSWYSWQLWSNDIPKFITADKGFQVRETTVLSDYGIWNFKWTEGCFWHFLLITTN